MCCYLVTVVKKANKFFFSSAPMIDEAFALPTSLFYPSLKKSHTRHPRSHMAIFLFACFFASPPPCQTIFSDERVGGVECLRLLHHGGTAFSIVLVIVIFVLHDTLTKNESNMGGKHKE